MTATYTNNGDGTSTIEFVYTHDTQRVLDVLADATYNVFEGSDAEWDALSNSEKLDLLDAHIRKVIVALADSVDAKRVRELAEENRPKDKYL